MKKKLKTALILMLLLGVLGYAIGVVIAYFTAEEDIEFVDALTQSIAFILLAAGAVIGFGMGAFTRKKKDIIGSNVGKTAQGEDTDINFDSKFITEERLKSDPDLIYCTWNNLPNLKKTGFVFRNKDVGGHYEVNMKPETHALVLGTTGTGKTQIFANPTIRILAHTGQKPSLVMTDPKGELYADNANILKKEGYNIVVLNLENPYASSLWNPMEIAYKTYERAGNLGKEVKKVSHAKPQDLGYKTFKPEDVQGATYGDVWYGFEGKAFPNETILKIELDAKQRQLESEAFASLKNIALSLIPDDPNARDKMWPDGCRDLVLGIMEAMLEDSRDPRLGMTLEKFNLFNLYKICMKRDPAGDRENALKTLTKYSEGRDPVVSNVHDLMSTVCLASPVTQRSFISTLGSSIGNILGDDGIFYMTSGTDIDFEDIPERPTAFFIRIPDHKTERHPLGVLCISQLYKVLVDVANRTVDPKSGKTGKLKRPVYFILDEFGNMPAVPKFGTLVTVSRSRGIFFEIVLQSYKQLDLKYGADEAQNIRGNFQMEVFLGSEDPSTIQAFSEACGEVTVFHEEENISRNTKDTDSGQNITKSVQRTRKPLLDKQKLRQLAQWTVVAKIFRKEIMMDTMTPFFATKCMEKSPAKEPVALSRKLDTKNVFYDIERRNKIVLKDEDF